METEGTRSQGIIGSDFEKNVVAQTPLGRVGQPEDVAKVALFSGVGRFRLDFRRDHIDGRRTALANKDGRIVRPMEVMMPPPVAPIMGSNFSEATSGGIALIALGWRGPSGRTEFQWLI